MNKLRVAIVDDSAVCRDVLREILEEEGDIDVTGEAADGTGTLEMMKSAVPDLVTVDIDMPKMGGLATVEEIMAHRPVPILIVTGRPPEQRATTLFQAVQRGALDLAEKPTLGRAAEASALRSLVRSLAKVPVMRHAPKPSATAPGAPAVEPLGLSVPLRIVGIGASAGGPAAVALVLQRLPRDLPVPVVVVQHILHGFGAAFAQFLRDQIALSVEIVTAPVAPRPGVVFLPSDDRHVVATPTGQLAASDARPYERHRPSVNALFSSLAGTFHASAMAVLLSGMGDDGAAGMSEMRARGAATIAQSKETCAVYGMPRAAIERGAARSSMSPEDIARAITRAAFREARG